MHCMGIYMSRAAARTGNLRKICRKSNRNKGGM